MSNAEHGLPKVIPTETIKTLWNSGFVRRWHSHPDARLRNSDDTTAAHQQRVAILLLLLFPDLARGNERFVLMALLHDAPEMFTGDVPSMTKRGATGVAEALDYAEEAWWSQMRGMEWMGMAATAPVNLCDLLDAILFVKAVAPDLLDCKAWQEDITKALSVATAMGVYPQVWRLLA